MATETKLDNTQAENKENKNAENGSKEKNGSKASKTTSSGPIKRAVAGGIIGATIGYVSTPENRKSLLDRIDTDELKSKASDLGTKVKEKSKSSVASLKTSAGSLFKKDKDKSKDDEENVIASIWGGTDSAPGLGMFGFVHSEPVAGDQEPQQNCAA